MKKMSLSSRLVEYLVGMLATAMIAAGIFLYTLQEPDRITQAQAAQLQIDLDQAMTLYAENCSVCHGLAGEGIGSIPALDTDALSQMDYSGLSKIISRGLFNTAMPAWGMEDGGPLSEYQIGTLVMLVQSGDWQATQDRVVNLGLAPLVPFTAEPDPLILTQLGTAEGGELLVQGITVYAQECVACHGADGKGTALAPALNDPAVLAKAPEELRRTILTGVPGTLMASWENSLTDQELDALVYMFTHWNEVPAGAVPAPEQPVPVTEESLVLGESLYASSCARCHGAEGQGTPRAPSLNVKSFLTDTNDSAIQQIITLGVPGTAMPAWGDRMTDAEIQAIVGFIRSWEPTAPEVAEPARGGGPWWKTGGSSTTGSPTGSPPWMSNQTTAPQGSLQMPSGGSADPQASVVQADPAVTQAVEQNNGLGAQATPSAQHQGAGQAATGAASSDPGSQAHTGGGPPWAAQAADPEWWQVLGWQAYVLLSSLIVVPMGLIFLAVNRLRRLPV